MERPKGYRTLVVVVPIVKREFKFTGKHRACNLGSLESRPSRDLKRYQNIEGASWWW